MNRSELVGVLSSRFPELGAGDVEAAVKTIVEAIGQNLASGNRVEIRGFGTFNVTVRAGRASRNPKTGEPVMVPRKATPRFKAGQLLRQRVNAVEGAHVASRGSLGAGALRQAGRDTQA